MREFENSAQKKFSQPAKNSKIELGFLKNRKNQFFRQARQKNKVSRKNPEKSSARAAKIQGNKQNLFPADITQKQNAWNKIQAGILKISARKKFSQRSKNSKFELEVLKNRKNQFFRQA